MMHGIVRNVQFLNARLYVIFYVWLNVGHFYRWGNALAYYVRIQKFAAIGGRRRRLAGTSIRLARMIIIIYTGTTGLRNASSFTVYSP